ncbi:MAG: outer membrane beta-barrel protein [Candidatus Kapabacteria bacterium]|nr:outer membrane beta-barrel protein [Ignavibacteriota bacterium]MCW5883916.1 outer membrane beta-barrel protein [Candidatus Kapabacteria bacterium]
MKFIVLVLSFIIFVSSNVFSQENVLRPKKPVSEQQTEMKSDPYKIRFGIEAGINYNMYNADLSWFPVVEQSLLNVYGKGDGISPYFSAMLDFPVSPQFGIQARVSYDMRSFGNDFNGIADCYVDDFSQIIDADVKISTAFSGADIGLSALLRYNISNEIEFTVGPMVLVPAGNYTIEETQTVLSDECFFNFDTDPTKQIVSEITLDDVQTRFGIDVGFSYNIPLSESVTLAPSLRFNYLFNDIFPGEIGIDDTRFSLFGDSLFELSKTRLNLLKFGLALWF